MSLVLRLRRALLAALAVGLLGLGGGAARGTEVAMPQSPLLVVVEAGPGAGCDAASVRAAIAGELKARVAAPKAPPVEALAARRSDILLVAIDHERIVVTLRGQGDRVLTRSIAAPGDRSGKLRAVAWLAGNVAPPRPEARRPRPFQLSDVVRARL
jgi:hypothetical protein